MTDLHPPTHVCHGGNACVLDPDRPHSHHICHDPECRCHQPVDYGDVFVGTAHEYRRVGWEWVGITLLEVLP